MFNYVYLDGAISGKTIFRPSSTTKKHVNLDNPVLQGSQFLFCALGEEKTRADDPSVRSQT